MPNKCINSLKDCSFEFELVRGWVETTLVDSAVGLTGAKTNCKIDNVIKLEFITDKSELF